MSPVINDGMGYITKAKLSLNGTSLGRIPGMSFSSTRYGVACFLDK